MFASMKKVGRKPVLWTFDFTTKEKKYRKKSETPQQQGYNDDKKRITMFFEPGPADTDIRAKDDYRMKMGNVPVDLPGKILDERDESYAGDVPCELC